MQPNRALGSQIWIEPDATAEQIDTLFAKAATSGLGMARLFLMWNWIEREPAVWDFGIWDQAFDAAERHDIRIKATLTANSGPWHVGTPAVQHTHTGFLTDDHLAHARTYVEKCVSRFADHPALAQWVLWNEPVDEAFGGEAYLAFWRKWLRTRYANDITALNRRWQCGFDDFAQVPYFAEVAHPAHRRSHWLVHRIGFDELACRADWLVQELRWVVEVVRAHDPSTPLCVNPTAIHANQPAMGTNLSAMTDMVDALGASFHPAWHFTFAPRHDFTALIHACVRHLTHIDGIRAVEVTELQTGNTYESSNRPCDVTPGEIVRWHLAAFAGGATSVTGWCFNARAQDFEAGDWGLLDDADEPSVRSEAVADLRQRLDRIVAKTGDWTPATPTLWIAVSNASQQRDAVREMNNTSSVAGRKVDDPAHAAAHLATIAAQLGVAASIAQLDVILARATKGQTVILPHVSVLTADESKALLGLVRSGVHVICDGLTGRYDRDALLHKRWPVGWTDAAGLRCVGLSTNFAHYPLVDLADRPAGIAAASRAVVDASDEWERSTDLRFAGDNSPVFLSRELGQGRLTFGRLLLAATLVHDADTHPHFRAWLAKQLPPADVRPLPAKAGVLALPVNCEHGRLTVILAENDDDVTLAVPAGTDHHDLWSDRPLGRATHGELRVRPESGVSLLWSA
ncbi:MAG: beta-galactosidase [Planctomycetota bacterium]